MSTELDKIKAKIRALATKTTANGCTEGEALAAMEKVGELLEVYNLTLADTVIHDEACIEAVVPLRRHTIPNWAFIFSTVAAFTQTRAWTSRPDVHFFGHEPDVQMAVYLSNVILDALETEAKRFKSSETYRQSFHRRQMTKSFKVGVISRLNERLKVKPVQAETDRQLVVSKLNHVSDELERQKPELKLRKRRYSAGRVNRDAYGAGRQAGDRVNINRPVSRSSNSVAGYLT